LSSLRDSFAYDVRMVTNRPARLASISGSRGLDTDYSAGELKQASVLFAQRGRPLDSTDAALCAAGRFSGTYSAFGVGDWGVCA